MWYAFLQQNYGSLESWQSYSDTYGLSERLGYASAEEAWEDNPYIKGSTDPRDFGLADAVKYYGRRMRRWTDEKLEKEAFFAIPGPDDSKPARDWYTAIKNEQARRATKA